MAKTTPTKKTLTSSKVPVAVQQARAKNGRFKATKKKDGPSSSSSLSPITAKISVPVKLHKEVRTLATPITSLSTRDNDDIDISRILVRLQKIEIVTAEAVDPTKKSMALTSSSVSNPAAVTFIVTPGEERNMKTLAGSGNMGVPLPPSLEAASQPTTTSSYEHHNQDNNDDCMMHNGKSNNDNKDDDDMESFFVEGAVLNRNMVYCSRSQRAFVYTSDLTPKGLPEMLFLDVPDDLFAARYCGEYVVKALGEALQKKVKQTVAEQVGDLCNYGDDDIPVFITNVLDNASNNRVYRPPKRALKAFSLRQFVQNAATSPSDDDGQHIHDNNNQHGAFTTAMKGLQGITFRMRFVQPNTQMWRLLKSNFLSCQGVSVQDPTGTNTAAPLEVPSITAVVAMFGILVLLPYVQEGSATSTFWGQLEGLPPPMDRLATMMVIDQYIRKVAVRMGVYGGLLPSISLSEEDEVVEMAEATKQMAIDNGSTKSKRQMASKGQLTTHDIGEALQASVSSLSNDSKMDQAASDTCSSDKKTTKAKAPPKKKKSLVKFSPKKKAAPKAASNKSPPKVTSQSVV